MSYVTVKSWNCNDEMEQKNTEAVQLYKEKYYKDPEWVICCPGRVNLIGEHIDHNGYGVLPMALRIATFVVVGRAEKSALNFENADFEKYKSISYDLKEAISVKKLNGIVEWFHYFIAGWRGAIENVFSIEEHPLDNIIEQIHGLNIAVAGSIPPSAGLSSSSALVCAATLATLAIQLDITALRNIDRRDLAEIAIKAERFVGTEGGGMDQACECLAEAEYALRIDFNPLSSTMVRLPTRALFAVMHSGVEMNKAANDYYNRRVVECRLAAQIMCKKAGLLDGNSLEIMKNIRTLRHTANAFGLGESDPIPMLSNVNKYLGLSNEYYTREDVCKILDINDQQLSELSLSDNTLSMKEFWLAKRARHVYSEAARVLAFEEICNRNTELDNSADDKFNKQTLTELAKLMNESHSSCKDDFECSCPELDTLVEKCREAGCLAARLTGAGWGGCVVALVDANEQAIIETISNKLDILFWSEPSEGIKAFKVVNEEEM